MGMEFWLPGVFGPGIWTFVFRVEIETTVIYSDTNMA
jgi:hypothetical protein